MSDTSTTNYPRFAGDLARDRLVEALRVDLLGPEQPGEILRQSPKTRYLVGMLAPNGTKMDASEDDQELARGDDDGGGGGATPPAIASMEASSIGLSVVVDGSAEAITAQATWGEYHAVTVELEESSDAGAAEEVDLSDYGLEPDKGPDEPPSTAAKTRTVVDWHRTPKSQSFEIGLASDSGIQEVDGVEISFLKRRLGDHWVVSVFLANVRERGSGIRPKDSDYLYQPTLVLSGDGAPFLPRSINQAMTIDSDPDIASADLTYRNRLEFGVGHGVAADWVTNEQADRAESVSSEVIPSFEVPKITPRESDSLAMDFLASRSIGEVTKRLSEFLDEYEAWLEKRSSEAETIEQPQRAVARDHVGLGRNSLKRMRGGLAALADDSVFEAFQFANQAMALQRRRSVQVSAVQRGEPVPDDVSIGAYWRPFQLGFVLQAIAGIANPKNEEREIADLLWFPTGGGKTEAYLGLTAMTLALRRLRTDGQFDWSAGTAVVMRYTLRLLTIQQFQRALTLIAACERIRRGDPERWGRERFTIGLWVGQSVTPNSFDDAKAALNRLRDDKPVFDKSPYQVLFCPWCGTNLSPNDYVSDDATQTVAINCPNVECDFCLANGAAGIPALVVDDEIYRNPPSLLLATVDKFAQMPWNGKIQSLFGRVEAHCARHGWISAAEQHPGTHAETDELDEVIVSKADRALGPPELIIQDELHLISGPLGTLVGIYESAVDALCAYHRDDAVIRPKVIASTATVRRAKQQVTSLFDRDMAVFPPQGLDASDSFFATEEPSDPGRVYVGVFGPGKSIKTTLVRTYGALLGRAKFEYDSGPSDETDAYMTLVGYFNSLRELGGAVRLVEDDVPSRLRTLERRGFCERRLLYENEELTSRKSTSRISTVLKKLDRTFLTKKEKEYPIDTLLSSNMISVGVDIDRLGLMVVSGQPKTTAEYIQATSRVGRQYPGLVVQVYNWVRPRDISHYEQFRHYHATFYRHVEATSVTPFSERARDRALPGVVVAHTRLSENELSAEQGAQSFDRDSQGVRDFSDFLVARATHVAKHGDEVGDETRQQVDNLLFEWRDMTDAKNGLVYSHRGQDKKQKDAAKQKVTLIRPMEMDNAKGQWAVSGSLREVEGENPIVLIDYEDRRP